MASPKEIVYDFLKGKGLPPNAIYGIMGNLMLESGFNTSATNPKSGAYGLAQWLGNRHQELNNYAFAHNEQPDNINAQLGFLWHELTSGYSSTLSQLQGATSPADAARIFEAGYEISGGQDEGARIAYAEQFAGGGGPDGSTASTDSTTSSRMTEDDYSSVDSLGKLLSTIPALKQLLDEALKNNWSTSKFQDEVENSEWYKTNSDTARSVLIQQANDPAAYRQRLIQTEQALMNLRGSSGFNASDHDINVIAREALLTGNDSNQTWMTQQLGHNVSYAKLTSLSGLTGQMAQTAQQLQSDASDYGFNYTPAQAALNAWRVTMGTTTLDTYKQQLMSWAESAFPALAKQIQGGQTVKDLASPYIQSMSNLLEIDPGSLDVYTPAIRQALQGYTDPATKQRESTPLWQFEDQVRQDPRWQYTQNARDTMSTALLKIGSDFGFGPSG